MKILARILLLLIATTIALVIGEYGARWIEGKRQKRQIADTHVPGGARLFRPFHPYLMYGDLYDTTDKLESREGPTKYGYVKAGEESYVFTFDQPVASMAERTDFLFQDRLELAEKSNKHLRVFIVGGSAAYGTGASKIETRYYVQLEELLNEKRSGKPVRMVPAAMGGYVSTQERLALELAVLPRKPDAVIIFNGFNDAAIPAMYGTRPGDFYTIGPMMRKYYGGPDGPAEWFREKSAMARLLIGNSKYTNLAKYLQSYREKILADPARLQNYVDSVTTVYRNNIQRMIKMCRNEGIPVAVFLQPGKILTNPGPTKLDSTDQLTLRAYESMLKECAAIPEFISLTDVFDKIGPDCYTDPVHFDDRGHRIVAEVMRPVVEKMIAPRSP